MLLAYSNHFQNGFQFDDLHTITDNSAIRDLSNFVSFFTDPTTSSSLPANQAYRPVVTLLNAFDYWMAGGLRPFYFHRSIFFWYLVQTVLLFFMFRKIMDLSLEHPWNPAFALLTTAFYALHTANAETINYVIARSDSFSTLCVVASLVLYQNRVSRRYHLYLITFLIGLYTKQPALMFVPLLFLYVLLLEPGAQVRDLGVFRWPRVRASLLASAPSFLVGVPLFLINQVYLTPSTTVSSNTEVTRLDYLLTQAYVMVHYLGNFVLPIRLSADPDFKVIQRWDDPRIVFGIFVIALLVSVAFRSALKTKYRPIGFGIAWFFVALAPSSSLVPLYQIANDHRTFFPYIGLALAVGWMAALVVIRFEKRLVRMAALRYGLYLLIALIIGAHAHGVHRRNQVWSSKEALWYDVTLKSPANGRGLMNYGLSQMEKGNYEVALDYYNRALKIIPYYSFLHINMGILKNATNKPAEAEEHFKDALRYDRLNPDAYYYYARWLNERNRQEEAVKLLKSSLQLSPGHVKTSNLLAVLERRAALDARSEIERLEARVSENPSTEALLDLSLAYYKSGSYRETIEACKRALVLEPDSFLAYNNICSAYARLGEWDLAIEACRKALEISPDFERAKANLKWAEDGKAGAFGQR